MEFLPIAAMAILTVKLIDFLRYARAVADPATRATGINGVVTQLMAWTAGVAVMLLVSHTAWAGEVLLGSYPLSKLGFWSFVFYGMSTASVGSLAVDFKKALDSSQSAVIPALVEPS
jgi:hypothetical protein